MGRKRALTYIVLPESALPVTVGLYHHVCRFGFADRYQPGLDGWEILPRGKEPDESMFGFIIPITSLGHPGGWIGRDLYLAFDKIHFSNTAWLSISNNVDEKSFVCMASKSNMLATLISSRAEGTTLVVQGLRLCAFRGRGFDPWSGNLDLICCTGWPKKSIHVKTKFNKNLAEHPSFSGELGR